MRSNRLMKLISLRGASLVEVQKQKEFEFRSIFRSLINRESKFFLIALLIFMFSVNLASAVEIKVWRFGGILAEHSWEKKKITEWNKIDKILYRL